MDGIHVTIAYMDPMGLCINFYTYVSIYVYIYMYYVSHIYIYIHRYVQQKIHTNAMYHHIVWEGVINICIYIYILCYPPGTCVSRRGRCIYIYTQIMYSMMLTNKPWFNYNCTIGDRLRS